MKAVPVAVEGVEVIPVEQEVHAELFEFCRPIAEGLIGCVLGAGAGPRGGRVACWVSRWDFPSPGAGQASTAGSGHGWGVEGRDLFCIEFEVDRLE